jgi:hypothetical protein
MKIYLLDINPHMTKAWEVYFKDIDDVEIVNTDFDNFMFDYKYKLCKSRVPRHRNFKVGERCRS